MVGLSEISRELKRRQEYLSEKPGRAYIHKRERVESRMAKIIIDEEYCKGCTLCINFCPQKVIRTSNVISNKGYHPAEFCDPEGKCTGCSLCAMMCPDAAIMVYRKKKVVGEEK
jgi:2-oxoglutarate ferredoxin oxidoreductase subunit delta